MTGVTYITNQEGKNTHVVLDLTAYGEAVRAFLEDLQDIETIKATAQDETYSLNETIEKLSKQGKVSKEDLQKMANVQG